jgi:hypothetical protein
MGGKESKPATVQAVEQENSSGFHFVEIHMPTAGVSVIVIIIILVIVLGCRRLLCFGRRPSAPYRVEAPPPSYASPPGYASPPPSQPYGYGYPQPWQSDMGWNRGLQGLALPLLTHIQELASRGVERCQSPPPARRPRATIAEVSPEEMPGEERKEAEAQTPRSFAI